MNIIEIQPFLWEGINFIAFLLACGLLLERRFGKKRSILVSAGFLIGIASLQAGLFLLGQDQMLILTLLPLTAYFPVIIGIHILSKSGFFQTAAVWTVGILVSCTLTFLQKLFIRYFHTPETVSPLQRSLIQTGCLLLAAALLLLIVSRFLRKPFRAYVLHNRTSWLLLCFPVIMIFLLFSYFISTTTNFTVWVLIFLTALSIILVMARTLQSAASVQRIQESEKAVAAQLEIQRREYEGICKKMELGRTYRHDMRHHLTVLEGLAGKDNNEELLRYISGLTGQLSEISQENYCENITINAVLSSCIGRAAKELGCSVRCSVQIPAQIPFDEIDVCVILANALENAVHACEKTAEARRNIQITADFRDNRKMTVSVVNPCDTQIEFDANGFPIVPKRKGHGIGLKSIAAIARKYNGLFHCECKEGQFRLRVVLFDPHEAPPPAKQKSAAKKTAAAALMSVFSFFFIINCMPLMAQAMEGIPGLGALVRVVSLSSYNLQWGDTALRAVLPQVELSGETPADTNDTKGLGTEATDPDTSPEPGPAIQPEPEPEQKPDIQPEPEPADSVPGQSNISAGSSTISWENGENPNTAPSLPIVQKPSGPSPDPTQPEQEPTDHITDGIDDINRQMEEFIQKMQRKFIWYAARKYHGYVGMDITYDTIRNDDTLLSVRFDATLNAGGSGQYSRCFTLDKRTGNVLELSDLFLDGSDYTGVISTEILRQMAEEVNAGSAIYFIPELGWPESSCFKEIAPDQNFYIDSQNRLVIVFDEYEVAPGSAGMPEFILPAEALDGILRQPSPIGNIQDKAR